MSLSKSVADMPVLVQSGPLLAMDVFEDCSVQFPRLARRVLARHDDDASQALFLEIRHVANGKTSQRIAALGVDTFPMSSRFRFLQIG